VTVATAVDAPLWVPSPERIARARLTAFRQAVEARWGVRVPDYATLYRFSIEQPERFWLSVWEFADVRAAARGERVVDNYDRMPGARFFPEARLNFAENLLRRRDEQPAVIFWNEHQVRRVLSFRQLYDEVSRLRQALAAAGVGPGDRVAGYLPNLPEAIVAALAAASLGAIWSSTSPDFGVSGVLDRFGQIEPKLLFSADGYPYGGKRFDTLEKLGAIVDALPSVERTVVIPYLTEQPRLDGIRGATSWAAFVEPYPARPIDFEPFPFDHPLYILYSSGTTGPPKCIVHGAGGTLIQHLKEHQLHCDIQPGDRVFYFTTCGWMMWNWLVSALASEATLLLYDGSPLYPTPAVLFDFAAATGMTLFGTSARYIDTLRKANLAPIDTHPLPSLRTMTSTGSPLAPESFDYVYERVKRDLHLASISGGTDIISCFVGGDPTGPVWRGEIQVRALGMKVEVFDEHGRSVRGVPGELVCTAPFPSMPLGFWNDPDGGKYRAAYFEKYPGVWWHGDWAEITAHDGVIIYGRSDAVLNPGGVRIGTAELYRQVEQFDEVLESVAVGQRWQGDERIILFVRLREGLTLDASLVERIKDRIRRNTTPRHVPAKIIQVADIPRTKNGKVVELAVRDVIHGREVKQRDALANPEALELFRNLPELAT
jgi:acetoacetyl-CoA synthetase